MIIREKEYKDCEAWVNVNVSSWSDNLKGVVSDKVLKFLRDNKDLRIEKDKANFIQDDYHYVLEDNNKVIGILKIKESERENFSNYGEVQILYLLTEERGKGYGKTLLNKAFEVLKRKGFSKCVIGCLVKNPSNDFYKRMGGKYACQEPWNLFDETYVENIYEYDI